MSHNKHRLDQLETYQYRRVLTEEDASAANLFKTIKFMADFKPRLLQYVG